MGREFTHVSMSNIRCKLNFSEPALQLSFYEQYCREIFDARNETLGLLERPQQSNQLIVDVDIKQTGVGRVPLYSVADVEKVVHWFQQGILTLFEDVNDEDLVCVYFHKEPYIRADGKTSHGFHLQFPFLFLQTEDYSRKLYKYVKEQEVRSPLPEGADIDKASFSNLWLMYGSRKEVGLQAYSVKTVYDCDLQAVDMGVLETCLERAGVAKAEERPLEYYFPIIFSILHRGQPVKRLRETYREAPQPAPPVAASLPPTTSECEEDVQEAAKLIGLLSNARAETYDQWIEIGWVLYNVGNGSQSAFDLWVQFSQRCPSKFDLCKSKALWEQTFRRGNYTMATLRYYAREDDPEGYKTFIHEKQMTYLYHHIDVLTDYDIAKLLYFEFGDTYRCASIQSRRWYEFYDHRWNLIQDAYSLRTRLSVDIHSKIRCIMQQKLREIAQEFASGQIDMEDKERKEKDVKTKYAKVLRALRTNRDKTNYMKEATDMFYDATFSKKLDQNSELFCFRNGVYDLKQGGLRDGRPEDYLSLQSPHAYREYNRDAPEIHELDDFFEKIFPDPDIRKYFLETTSEIFQGGNRRKLVLVWSGHGDNGKSVTQSLIELMLGPYAVKFPTSLITGKRTASSSACPELARAGNGVRFAVVQEPDHKDMINIGILKELSGNDTFFARGLYQDGEEKTPMFKFYLICNNLPSLPSDDIATWNRIRVVPFESCFVNKDTIPDDPLLQKQMKRFPKDPNFLQKIPAMIEPFIWYLLDIFERVKTQSKIHEPARVSNATTLYRKANDLIYQCIEQNVQKDEDERSCISLNDFYQFYKEWLKQSGIFRHTETRFEVNLYLEREWGKPFKYELWKGRKFRVTQDELDSGNCLLLDKTT